ncbi:MAG: nucleotide exchange factor GrpE [Steroidobacteraceae bacterium]
MSNPEESTPPEVSVDTALAAEPALISEVDTMKAALEAAEARANEGRDQALRAMAELENVRKRAARDVENAHKYALEKFAGEVIAVKDSLEMGLSVQNASAEDLRSGSEATLKLLSKAFEKSGIVAVMPEGEAFNPEFHEAMAMVPTTDQAPNTIINVVQSGYLLSGRLLRPARVIVARAPD